MISQGRVPPIFQDSLRCRKHRSFAVLRCRGPAWLRRESDAMKVDSKARAHMCLVQNTAVNMHSPKCVAGHRILWFCLCASERGLAARIQAALTPTRLGARIGKTSSTLVLSSSIVIFFILDSIADYRHAAYGRGYRVVQVDLPSHSESCSARRLHRIFPIFHLDLA